MHSRMSSSRPSSIFLGRKGSAIEGRAAPMKSRMPRRIWATMLSGEVKRPTPTTGLVVSCLTKAVKGSCEPSALKREVVESFDQGLTLTSQRSGSSASISTTSRPSPSALIPASPSSSSVAKRTAMAQLSPTASFVSSMISRSSRARFSRLPPYSSSAVVAPALQEMHRQARGRGRHSNRRCRSRRAWRAARPRDASGDSCGCPALSMARAWAG